MSWSQPGIGMSGAAASARGPLRAIDGIVLLDKPLGLSSNQALQRVKRVLRAEKAGHAGSLDPLATGMLPVCLGQATKFSGYLLDSDKCYRVQIAFGTATSSGDCEGSPSATGPKEISESALTDVLRSFHGHLSQTPPMHSALRHRGKRLYELARSGQEVPREPRSVHIHRIAIETYHPSEPVLRIWCSKGTYVRTLVEDIARAAGTVGHVAALRRLTVGDFQESMMIDLPTLEAAVTGSEALPDRLLLPPDAALRHMPACVLNEADCLRLRQGKAVKSTGPAEPGSVRLYGLNGDFLGVGEHLQDQQIVPRRLMAGS